MSIAWFTGDVRLSAVECLITVPYSLAGSVSKDELEPSWSGHAMSVYAVHPCS